MPRLYREQPRGLAPIARPLSPARAAQDCDRNREDGDHSDAGHREARARRGDRGNRAAQEEADAREAARERFEKADDPRLVGLGRELLNRRDDGDPLDAVARAADG